MGSSLGLVAQILPLIPDAVEALVKIIRVLRSHESTPNELKARLDAISADLDAACAKVQAVVLPEPRR